MVHNCEEFKIQRELRSKNSNLYLINEYDENTLLINLNDVLEGNFKRYLKDLNNIFLD
jgi:hypothetical protein